VILPRASLDRFMAQFAKCGLRPFGLLYGMLFGRGFRVPAVLVAAVLVAGCAGRRPGGSASSGALADDSPERERQRVEAHAHYASAVAHEVNGDVDQALDHYVQAASNDIRNEALVLEVSRKLLQAKRAESAVELLERATKQADAPASLHARLGVAYAQLGQTDRAVNANRAAIRKEPESIVGYQNLFVLYMQARQPEQALEALDSAARLSRADVNFLISVGELYGALGAQDPNFREPARARGLAVLERAAKQPIDDPQTRLRLANAFSLLDQSERAAPVYEELLVQVDDIPVLRESVRARLAEIYLRSKDSSRAREHLEKLLESNPTDAEVYYYLGRLADQEGRFADAVEYFSKELLLSPESPGAHDRLAIAQIRNNQPGDALETLERARKRFGPTFYTEYFAGIASSMREDYTNAVQYLRAAEIIAGSRHVDQLDASFYFQLGAACERTGDYAAAERHFEKCLELRPDFPEAQNYLGYMLADRGEQLERARELIAQALKAEPENAAYLDSMGWVLFRLGQTEEALKYILNAVRLAEEEDAVLYDHLGDIYMKLGQPDKAREAWQKSLGVEDSEAVRKKLQPSRAGDSR